MEQARSESHGSNDERMRQDREGHTVSHSRITALPLFVPLRTHHRNANVAVADGITRQLFHRGKNTEARAGYGAFGHVEAALVDITTGRSGACSIVTAAAGLRFLRRCGGGATSRQWQLY